ncbi:30S ribosomal protein S5 [Candidatus Fokinia crypta]|uniref:Small ribosomal subunit protein uS5 n=1 Tax=Candidatus Fokinia crypta TaxID=1920990 RepID=A0ABZ0UQJ9_9RICK|nr:30S ribosomal protein S5 [Candidatus Fokinia cryptica]WPX97942.1 30S ribosomal protein S5 [Candidatus Fokinia cryptica]
MKQAKSQRHDTLQEEVVSVSRVVKVVKGGRRFSFRALVVVGDRRGSVGIGLGKANEVSDAKAKAAHSARSNMVRIHLRDGRTLHHIVESKSGATKVLMRPAQHGAGVIAGPSLRAFLEVLGVKDVVSKCIGSTNPFTVLSAAKKALLQSRSPRAIAMARGIPASYIFRNRTDYGKLPQEENDNNASEVTDTKASE